ncbi:hypothetical protein [Staphylococcus equorum]|uniref:hypothetical protein n=1 Tax=Staphylococcus equorum TaxID=246432 RepID=UPI000853AF10|nr:hypothetical protein [Staphylococcus equorum]OEL08230.1 hypothetical protein AST04_08580 [Staphylococcus equorum]
MGLNISFEKATPEEKEAKKAKKRAKRKERYGHLAEADDGSFAKFLTTKFSKNKKEKFFSEDKDDLSFFKEPEEGSAVKYVEDLTNRMFPDKAEKKRRKEDKKKKQQKNHDK